MDGQAAGGDAALRPTLGLLLGVFPGDLGWSASLIVFFVAIVIDSLAR